MTHALCPAAGKRGKPVPLVTLRSLVLPEHAAVVEEIVRLIADRAVCDFEV